MVDMGINIKTKSIEQMLRELVMAKGLRRTAHDLDINPASLHRSLKDGSNIKLERVKKLLDYLGYEVRIVEITGRNRMNSKNRYERRRNTM